MKIDLHDCKFWNGREWESLPTNGFQLSDATYCSVGFYRVFDPSGGARFRCQFGGDWPEPFDDWNIHLPEHQAKLNAWVQNVHDRWTGVFDIKRHGCPSSSPAHCRYSTTADVQLQEQIAFSTGTVIIVDKWIHTNTSVFFIGDQAIALLTHEFGHYVGNLDEYAGAQFIDRSLNDDGAKNGVDITSIMGEKPAEGKVKKRHYRTICKHLANMVLKQRGENHTYEAVPPL